MSAPERVWFDEVRRYTRELVAIRGVSPSRDENEVGEAIHRLLAEALRAAGDAAEMGFDPIPGDPWGRANVWGIIPGQSTRAVVLMGHFDTVGTGDYGALEPWALDSDGLAERVDALAAT